MGETLKFQDNDNNHRCHADTLGQLQAGVVKGTVTKNTPNAYFMGRELLEAFPGSKGHGEAFLKMDCTGSGTGNSRRSKNRIVVKVKVNRNRGAETLELVEGEAWLWRHDDRVLKLDDGFFKRAQTMRKFAGA